MKRKSEGDSLRFTKAANAGGDRGKIRGESKGGSLQWKDQGFISIDRVKKVHPQRAGFDLP